MGEENGRGERRETMGEKVGVHHRLLIDQARVITSTRSSKIESNKKVSTCTLLHLSSINVYRQR